MTLLNEEIAPSPRAYGAEPFSVLEIDRHPDKDRIWATILAMRAGHGTAIDEASGRYARCDDCGRPV
jgi:hypothetical protein